MDMNTKLSIVVSILLGVLVAGPAGATETSSLVDGYLAISTALADDDLATAKTSSGSLAQEAHATGNHALAEPAAKLAEAGTIEDARGTFKTLSNGVIKLTEGQAGYYVMTCPMVKAEWLQKTKELANPYMGKAMLKCGSIKNGPSAGNGCGHGCGK